MGMMDDVMAQIKKKGSDFLTGADHMNPVSNLNRVSAALGSAMAAGDAAELKSYQDKYGPTQGQRLYEQDQAKKKQPAGGK